MYILNIINILQLQMLNKRKKEELHTLGLYFDCVMNNI